jgi:hypothetical protein
MIVQVKLKNDAGGNPILDSLSPDHEGLSAIISKTVRECGSAPPDYIIGLAEAYIQRAKIPISWMVFYTDGAGEIWQSMFLRPEDRHLVVDPKFDQIPPQVA